MTELKIGGIFTVEHSRRGVFTFAITDIDQRWVTGIVKGGSPKFMRIDGRWPGDSITVLIDLIKIHTNHDAGSQNRI